MIKIISGVCRTELGLKKSSDEPFALTAEAEQRLVNRKVAVYVYPEAPAAPVATPPAAPEDEGAGVTSPQGNLPTEDEETAALLTAEQLESMKLDEMRSYCEQLGIDTTGMRYKKDILAAYAEYLTTAPEDGNLPDLTVGGPVE